MQPHASNASQEAAGEQSTCDAEYNSVQKRWEVGAHATMAVHMPARFPVSAFL